MVKCGAERTLRTTAVAAAADIPAEQKNIERVTLENYETEKSKHGELNQLYQAPLLLLKVDLTHWGKHCKWQWFGIYPPADPKALAEAKNFLSKKRTRTRSGHLGYRSRHHRRRRALLLWPGDDRCYRGSRGNQKETELLEGMAALGKGGLSDWRLLSHHGAKLKKEKLIYIQYYSYRMLNVWLDPAGTTKNRNIRVWLRIMCGHLRCHSSKDAARSPHSRGTA